MKTLIYAVFVLLLSTPFISLGQDLEIYYQDTAITLDNYTLQICRDRYDRNGEVYDEENLPYEPITIIISDIETEEVIIQKRFDQNEFDIYPEVNGNLPIGLIASGGGSRFSGVLYLFSVEDWEPTFTKLFTYNELSYFAFSESGKDIILLKGLWNMDEYDSHFDNHIYQISKITLTHRGPIKTELGKTRFKYSSLDDGETMDQILFDIKSREPQLLRSVDLSTYVF